MVSFKVPKKTTMILEYLDDPKPDEAQNLISPWASLEVRQENLGDTTHLFIHPPKNFESPIN